MSPTAPAEPTQAKKKSRARRDRATRAGGIFEHCLGDDLQDILGQQSNGVLFVVESKRVPGLGGGWGLSDPDKLF